VTTLVTKVTEGGKASRRRRVLAIVGGAAVLAGGAAFGAVKLLGGSSHAAADATVVALIDASTRDDAISEADRILDAAVADAPPATPMVVDASVRARADAGTRGRDAAALLPADAAAAADAAPLVPPPADAAVRENGFIVVKNDTWCDVSVDGVDYGQILQKTKQPISVPAGDHVVVCAQKGTANRWTRTVKVTSGATVSAEGAMLGIVIVTVAVDANIDGIDYAANTKLETLKAGRHDLVIGGKKTFFTLRVPCTVRASPEPGCY
jgi:hypothetical protein